MQCIHSADASARVHWGWNAKTGRAMVADIIDFELVFPRQFPLDAKVPRQVVRVFVMVVLDHQGNPNCSCVDCPFGLAVRDQRASYRCCEGGIRECRIRAIGKAG